jgi:hypothetical protein
MDVAIETPCIQVCVIDPRSGFCIGCGRTGEEIAAWLDLSPGDRRAVMATLPDRLAMMVSRKGRRDARAAAG